MKTMSEFVNLSLKEQFEELNKGRWPKPEVRIPAPNAEARKIAKECQSETPSAAEAYNAGYKDGFNDAMHLALTEMQKEIQRRMENN